MICTRTLKDLYKSFKQFIEKVRTRDCQSTYKRLRKYVERVEKVAFSVAKQSLRRRCPMNSQSRLQRLFVEKK